MHGLPRLGRQRFAAGAVAGQWPLARSATVACNRSRTSSPMALRSRGIIRSRCRRKAARRFRTPTSPPSPLMSGPSAIPEEVGTKAQASFRSNGATGPWNEERKDHVQDYLRALSRSRRRLSEILRPRRLAQVDALPPVARRCRRREIDFVPGHLLGSVSGELGLRKFIESQGYELIVTTRTVPTRYSSVSSRCGSRDIAAVLAGLSDGRADRQGAETETRHHRRYWFPSICRPRSTAASRWPKSPIPTRSALPSMW